MDTDTRWPSTVAWLGLVAYVAVADVILERHQWPLLSTSARVALRHRHHRWPVFATWVVLSVHLATDADHDPTSIVVRHVAHRLRR